MINDDDEVIKSTYLMLEAMAKEKEEAKKARKIKGKERDLDQARLYQHGYIEREKQEGKVYVSLCLDGDNISNIDSEIVEAAKEQKKLKRSDVINVALKFYFEKKNKND